MADNRVLHWRADPVKFIREVLGQVLWRKQRDIARSVRDNPFTVVQSGFGMGKTHIAACLVLWFYACFPKSRVVTTANTWDQVERVLWALIGRLFKEAKVPIGGLCYQTFLRKATEWLAYGVSVDDPNAFQGAHNRFQFLVFDEAQGIPRELWEAGDAIMVGKFCRWLAIGNPLEPSGPFFEKCRPGSGWNRIKMSCFEHPNVVTGEEVIHGAVDTAWVERKRKAWNPDGDGKHPMWMSRVMGEFPESGDKTVIPLSYLEAAKNCVPTQKDGVHLGVDIARQGADFNSACLLVDRKVTEIIRWGGMDGMYTVGKIIDLQKRFNVLDQNVHLDNISYGAIVADRALELGHSWDRVGFGNDPEWDWGELLSDTKLLNRRAELFWVARELLRTKQLCVPERFEEAWTDLTTPCYKFQSESKIVVEPKDEVKKKLHRSPDDGDAILLSLSRVASCGLGITSW